MPLVTANAEEPFVLEIRYTSTGGKTLSLPAFPDETAVQKVYLCAFVPPAQDVVGTSGSWAEDFSGVGETRTAGCRSTRIHETMKVEWVCKDNNGALGAAKTFHVDGTPLIFSTLRPDPQTNVRLWTLDHQALDAWIFGVVLLGGAVLVLDEPGPSRDRRGRAGRRPGASGRLLADAVAARFGCPLFAAVAIVLLFWAVVGLFRLCQPLMALWHGLNTTWSAWVAGRKATAEKAPGRLRRRRARNRKTRRSAQDGGASHGLSRRWLEHGMDSATRSDQNGPFRSFVLPHCRCALTPGLRRPRRVAAARRHAEPQPPTKPARSTFRSPT